MVEEDADLFVLWMMPGCQRRFPCHRRFHNKECTPVEAHGSSRLVTDRVFDQHTT